MYLVVTGSVMVLFIPCAHCGAPPVRQAPPGAGGGRGGAWCCLRQHEALPSPPLGTHENGLQIPEIKTQVGVWQGGPSMASVAGWAKYGPNPDTRLESGSPAETGRPSFTRPPLAQAVRGRRVWTETSSLQNLKGSLSGPLQRVFAKLRLENELV